MVVAASTTEARASLQKDRDPSSHLEPRGRDDAEKLRFSVLVD
jgi:hypothetical protein